MTGVTSPCINGEKATVSIIGKPGTVYKISVYYSTRVSEAKGLEEKTSDPDGNVSWTWKVGSNTKEGEHKIKIEGGGESIETSFVTKKPG